MADSDGDTAAKSPSGDGQHPFAHLLHASADAHEAAAAAHQQASDAHHVAAENMHAAADAAQEAQAANEGTRSLGAASAQRSAVNRVANNARTARTFRGLTGRR